MSEENTNNNQNDSTNNTTVVSKYYDKKLYHMGDYLKRMIHNGITYSNFYYKDTNGTIYFWHRKRKGKYAVMPGNSVVYIDAEASMERFTGLATYYSVIEPWKRAPVFHGILNGEAIFTVVGSSKFDDTDEVYLAKSKDGLLIEPVLDIHETASSWNTRFLDWFIPNYKGKLGHFITKQYKEEGDPAPNYNLRHKIFCHNYDGLNYTVNVCAKDYYSDGDTLELLMYSDFQAKGELYEVAKRYPIYIYRYIMDRTANIEANKNLHNFASYYVSQYLPRCDYYWYKMYNANTGQTTDFPFVTILDEINTWWNDPDSYASTQGGGVKSIVKDPKTFDVWYLRSICIMPYIDVLGVCPNGNILVSIIYNVGNKASNIGESFPEYKNFIRFFICPKYFVIDGATGQWTESNIKESIETDLSDAMYSNVSISPDMRPIGLYTDSEFLWFRKRYKEQNDITFYGTRDGYTIDKQITYYNRTTVPAKFHMMVKKIDAEEELINDYNIEKGYMGPVVSSGSAFVPVPFFEDGVFKKFMVAVAARYSVDYETSYAYGLVEDLTPNYSGFLDVTLTYSPTDNQRYDRYRIRYTKKQPDQTDEDYIYDIE